MKIVVDDDVLDIRDTERPGMFDNDLWALAQTGSGRSSPRIRAFQRTAMTCTTVY
jgi:hypothetical protein